MAMPKIRSQTVPYLEHPTVRASPRLNWEDLRVFLSVGRNRSFRASAGELGLSFNTVRRHVDSLEHATRTVLFARHARGIQLTPDGQALLQRAQSMESAAQEVDRFSHRSRGIAGRVKISVTEGLGTFWLIPRLVGFQRGHPNIILEVNCTFREPDVRRMEADISIQFSPPTHGDLKAVRLGRMHVMAFASPEYLRTFGHPKTLREVESHKIIEQLSPQLDVSAVDRLFPNREREGFVAVATNTSTAHFWAVLRGAGLGMLPTYLAALGAKIVPLSLDLRLAHDIWLVYHPDSRRLKRIGATIDSIREAFNPSRFPWFSDTFIHPDELKSTDRSLVADTHFAGLVAT